jgi:hypothetical protein
MEQRPLRLGDILDDYCPRERRVTNHAIVAMIDEDVRQTRCTTCDAEHVYKGGKAPKRRKKETPSALYKEVLAGMPELDTPVLAIPTASSSHEADVPDTLEDDHDLDVHEVQGVEDVQDVQDAPDAGVLATQAEEEAPMPSVEEGPVHRPLIRAQLPKIEGQKELRQAPDFTMRQPIGRGHFRGGGGMKPRGGGQGGPPNGNGNRPHGGGSRFAGPRPGGQGRGPGGAPGRGGAAGGGFRSGQTRQGGGGRKRSR